MRCPIEKLKSCMGKPPSSRALAHAAMTTIADLIEARGYFQPCLRSAGGQKVTVEECALFRVGVCRVQSVGVSRLGQKRSGNPQAGETEACGVCGAIVLKDRMEARLTALNRHWHQWLNTQLPSPPLHNPKPFDTHRLRLHGLYTSPRHHGSDRNQWRGSSSLLVWRRF